MPSLLHGQWSGRLGAEARGEERVGVGLYGLWGARASVERVGGGGNKLRQLGCVLQLGGKQEFCVAMLDLVRVLNIIRMTSQHVVLLAPVCQPLAWLIVFFKLGRLNL